VVRMIKSKVPTMRLEDRTVQGTIRLILDTVGYALDNASPSRVGSKLLHPNMFNFVRYLRVTSQSPMIVNLIRYLQPSIVFVLVHSHSIPRIRDKNRRPVINFVIS
jgi:hypothetical protein